MPRISVVSPVYKAESCVPELCRRLKLVLESMTDDFEIILVEDRSPDKSWQAVENETQKDDRVRGIRLAKNFGQHRAITAGLDAARGDWVVVMDCDLQDPPEAIPELYKKACEGYEIVVAQFEDRAEPTLRQKISKIFWNTLSWLAGIPFDHRIGNFRIMSRLVVENFRQYREQLRLLGGISMLMGFTSAAISLKRERRFAGETSYSLYKLLAMAFDVTMAYSDRPLRISVGIGLAISVSSMLVAFALLLLRFSGGVQIQGWVSVMVSLYFLGGLIIANLGLLGYYLGKTFDESKRRPLYVIEKTLNAHSADCKWARRQTARHRMPQQSLRRKFEKTESRRRARGRTPPLPSDK